MIVIVDPKENSLSMVGRYVELHYLMQANPGHDVAFLPDADLSNMNRGETLFILGHGGLDEVGSASWPFSPGELAGELLHRSLKAKTYIVLGSCKGGVQKIGRNTSYFQEMMAAIWAGGAMPVSGEAYRGVTAITQSGTYLVKDPAQESILTQAQYSAIIRNNALELNVAVGALKRLHRGRTLSLGSIAEAIMEMTTTTFEQLFMHNAAFALVNDTTQRVRVGLG